MGDMLEEIWQRQRELHDMYRKERYPAGIDSMDEIRLLTLAAMVELGEALQLTPWKPWKKPELVDFPKLKEELADVMHFYVELCIIIGFDAGDMYQAYMSKAKVNEQRTMGDY